MIGNVLVIPDLHVPYHHKVAWDLTLRIIKTEKPAVVVQLGDFGDFEAVASHPKKFGRKLAFDDELAACRKEMKRLQVACGDAKLVVLQGNHEERFERYIAHNAPHAETVQPSARKLLGLRSKDVWVPYRSHWKLGKVLFLHDVGHSGKNATTQTLDAVGSCVVHGHTHRAAVNFDGTVLDESQDRFAMGCGWMGDREKITYLHRTQMRGWRLSLGWLQFKRGGVAWPTLCPFLSNGTRIIVSGKEYCA